VIEPEQVDVWLGMDVGKSEQFHTTLDDDGEQLSAAAVGNPQSHRKGSPPSSSTGNRWSPAPTPLR
jgi:hypothetical protein